MDLKGRVARTAAPLLIAAPLCFSVSPSRAETRGYVISTFSPAVQTDYHANCPQDKNGLHADLLVRYLMEIGYSKQEAVTVLENQGAFLSNELFTRIATRARINGKPANAADYPDAVPDPNIETVTGRYAYGFDLGGKNKANKFEDPDTHEKIDNQLWRAVGCTENFRIQGGEGMTGLAAGWSIMISGQHLDQDGPVTVTLDRLLQHLEADANGKVMWHATYVIDPSPRLRNVFKGKIEGGWLTIEPGSDLFLLTEEPFAVDINLANIHMRLHNEADGRLTGYWGGYTDWQKFAFRYTSYPNAGDEIGIYHALKKLADASPDSKTGQNREISATYRVEAVPAYLGTMDGKIVATPVRNQPPATVAAK